MGRVHLSTNTFRIVLAPGREKNVLRGHPWIFAGAVAHVDGNPAAGSTVDVVSASGAHLGSAAYSPVSMMRARMWGRFAASEMGAGEIAHRVRAAIAYRSQLKSLQGNTGIRLVHGEADGLPGLVVDRYGSWLVCQFLSAGVEFWRSAIVDTLTEVLSPKGIWERSDTDARRKEGLEPRTGLIAGEEPPPEIEVTEDGLKLLCDPRNGHKTGLYLDQSLNRRLVESLAEGREVLNCFCYTGSFGLRAMRGKARSVLQVDSSAPALEVARKQAEINGLATGMELLEGDVFQVLRKFRDSRRSFDLIVLDPPKFSDSREALPKAARGYKDINLLALKLLRPGGLLATFSCSGAVTPEFFRKIVSDAAADAGRDFRVLYTLEQAPDHPSSLAFPEGLYLKGLVVAAP